jgi:hypothetical protein
MEAVPLQAVQQSATHSYIIVGYQNCWIFGHVEELHFGLRGH